MPDNRSPSHDDRLARLEADVLRLTDLSDRSPERDPIAGQPRQPRPAKTYRRDGASYPSDPCTVYPIIFLDSTFTETEGDESRTDTDRQANGEELAFYDGDYLAEDTIVDVYRDNARWWIMRRAGSGNILWAEIQSGATNVRGDGPGSFSGKSCDWDGTGVTGDAFTVKTQPVHNNGVGLYDAPKMTSLFEGYIVGYQEESDGTKVIVTDCWDEPEGSYRMIRPTDIGRIPDGWSEVTVYREQFMRLKAEIGNGITGGANTHTHNPHCDHGVTTYYYEGGATGGVWFLTEGDSTHSENHSTEDNVPEFFDVLLIERDS